MVWILLLFDRPPLNCSRRTSNGALLAAAGTGKVTSCGPPIVSGTALPAVKVPPPLMLYEKLYVGEAIPGANAREAHRHVSERSLAT